MGGRKGEGWSRVPYLTLPGETPNVKQNNRPAAWQGVKPEQESIGAEQGPTIRHAGPMFLWYCLI